MNTKNEKLAPIPRQPRVMTHPLLYRGQPREKKSLDIVVDDGDKALTQPIKGPERVKRSRPKRQRIGKSEGGHGTGHAADTSTKVRGAGATR